MNDLEVNLQKISGKAVPKSKTARFRQYMGEIELMISQGFYHEEINQALREAGFDISIAMFRSMLYRERGRKARKASASRTSAVLQTKSREGGHAGLPIESGRVNAPAETGRAVYDHSEYRNREPKW